MISDKLITKIKKIPYGGQLSVIYRNNSELLDACIALGRIDLLSSFSEQAFTAEVLERRATQLAQCLRKVSIDSTFLTEYYLKKNDIRTAFRCMGANAITRSLLKKYGKVIIEGLKKSRYVPHKFLGDSKLLYKYLLANREYGLAFSDEFLKFNKNLIRRIGVSVCADAMEQQFEKIPMNLMYNRELFTELLRRKNYHLAMAFDSSLLTEEIVSKYKKEFIETILKKGKVNMGVTGSKILASYFREQKNYKILVQFYKYDFELSNDEFETVVREIDASQTVPGIFKGNEPLFNYYVKKRDVKILFQFDPVLIKKHDIFNRFINEIISLIRASERIYLHLYLDNDQMIKLIEHDAVDVIIKLYDNSSYSLISNDVIMDKCGEKVLHAIENLELDVYNVSDPNVFKNLLKYKKFGYLLRAKGKMFNKYVGSEYYPDLAAYLMKHRDKFTIYIRNNKSFFNYCFDNKHYDLLLSFNYWFLTPKKVAGMEDKIIECITNDTDYPNLFRENEELAYHLYNYAVKNKRYDFLFEHCSDHIFLKMFDRYASPEERELEKEFLSRVGLSREEVHERLNKYLKTNDDVFQTINPMILAHKYDAIDEKELQRFVMYPDIQKRIVALNEDELKVLNVILKKINSKRVKIDRSNLIGNVIKNLHKYEKIIKEINIDTIDDDLLEKLICLLNDSSNYYNILTIDELKAYDEMVLRKFRLIEASLPRLNIFELREAVFRKKFGISLDEAKFIFDRYCDDMQAVNDSKLSNEVKIVLNEIKNIFAASKIELKFMFISSKTSVSNKHKYDSLESIIRTNYAKLYNDCLYKPKEEDRISAEFKNKYFKDVSVPVYMPTGDFNMQTHSLGAYREFHEPINWKTSWNRPKTAYHGICTTFITNELIAPARSFHPIYGFSGYKENEMLCAGNYDLNSDRAIAKYDTSRAYPYGFYSPEHMVNKTRHSHNEIVIERMTNGVKRQPDYVVYIVDDANDPRFFNPQNKRFQEIVAAAEDFNIPIVIVDRLQQAKRSMAMIESMKKEMAEDFEKFANEGKVQELLFKYLNNRIGCIKYNIENKSKVYEYFTDEICIKAINDIWDFISEAPDSIAKCNALKQLIYVLANEHSNWNEAKLDSNDIGWILNAASKMLSSIDSKYRVEDDEKNRKALNRKEQIRYIYEAYTKYPGFRKQIEKDLSEGVDYETIIQKIYTYLDQNYDPTIRGGGGRQ